MRYLQKRVKNWRIILFKQYMSDFLQYLQSKSNIPLLLSIHRHQTLVHPKEINHKPENVVYFTRIHLIIRRQ